MGIYLDLTKAFDTVQHNILLDKLYLYGVRGVANKWFDSYLSGRKQYVSVNGCDSEMQSVTTGVPRGSVLGPLLFLIYINDIANAISNKNSQLVIFADDTNIFLTNKDMWLLKLEAEKTLNELSILFACNKLTLSIEKTQYNVFYTRRKQVPVYWDILTVQGHVTKRSGDAKYLGFILDEHLTWNAYVN